MSPPRIEFVDHLDVVFVVDLVGRQNAVFVSGQEENDRDHQGAGELEGGVLGEGKVVRHCEGSIGERVNADLAHWRTLMNAPLTGRPAIEVCKVVIRSLEEIASQT